MVAEMKSVVKDDKDMAWHGFVYCCCWLAIDWGVTNTDNKGFMQCIKSQYPPIQQSLLLTLELLSSAS